MNVSLAQADGPAELRVAVAQDAASGEVRMVGFASAEAVEATLRSRKATFWSRSRGRLWQKGESSGNELRVVEVWADCDEDAVIYLVDPVGPTCHTGAPSCFHRRLDGGEGEVSRALPSLARLAERLAARRESTAATSYTRQLLEAGASRIAEKIREEATEVAAALECEGDERLLSECADLLYHVSVGLLSRGLSIRDVEMELLRREGTSGLEEKAGRARQSR